MPDPTDPLRSLHQERTEAKSFRELREEFRAENLKRVRAMTRPDDLQLKDKDGNVIKRISTGLRTTAPRGQDYRKPDEFLAAGGEIPNFDAMPEDFTTLPVPQVKLEDLAENMQDVLQGERVRHGANPTGDESRESPPLASLDEETLLDYTATHVQRECGQAGLAPHLNPKPGGNDNARETSSERPISEREGSSSLGPGGECAGPSPQGEGQGPSDTIKRCLDAAESAVRSPEFQNWWEGYKARTAAPFSAGCYPPYTTHRTAEGVWYVNPSGLYTGYARYAANSPPPLHPWHRAWNLFVAAVRSALQRCRGRRGQGTD